MEQTERITIEWCDDDLNRIEVFRDEAFIVYEESQPENDRTNSEVRVKVETDVRPFRFLITRFANGQGPGLLGEYWSYPGTVFSGISEWEIKLIPYFLWKESFGVLVGLEDRHLEIIASKLGQEFY